MKDDSFEVDENEIDMSPIQNEQFFNREPVVLPPIVQPLILNASVNAQSNSQTSAQPNFYQSKNGPVELWTPAQIKKRRIRNLVSGILMFVNSLLIILLFVLSFSPISQSLGGFYSIVPFFKFEGTLNVIDSLYMFFSNLAVASTSWKLALPSFLLVVSLIFVLVNTGEAIANMCWRTRGISTIGGSFVSLLFAIIPFFMAIIGAETLLGYPKVPVAEMFANLSAPTSNSAIIMFVFAENLLMSILCAIIKAPKPKSVSIYR